jgi:hypothetical protein
MSIAVGGGGLGCKLPGPEFTSILATLYLILLLYGFHESRGSQFNVPIPLSSTPIALYVLNSKSPASAMLLNHLALLQFLNHNKVAPSP